MRTGERVQAGIRNPEPRDRTAFHKVGLNDLFNVGFADSAVPDCLRIDDNHRAVLALIQASGLVDADHGRELSLGNLALKEAQQRSFFCRIAGGARVARLARVGADEDVKIKARHGFILASRDRAGIAKFQGSAATLECARTPASQMAHCKQRISCGEPGRRKL